MMNTYIKYIKNPLVKEDAEKHTKIKGTTTGAVGRPSILPVQLGHDVTICGDYEYCLGCGRSTKTKHIDTAKHVFSRREICTPILRLRQYQDKHHKVGFKDWWYRTACEAKGPTMNNKFCSSYTHKIWKTLTVTIAIMTVATISLDIKSGRKHII
eukprot:1253871-Heterocapsa_arctica.AAC.1